MKKKTGMVIVNYNDFLITKRLIENIKDYKVLEKIVIVDNNSTDDSFERLKELESTKITIIKNSSRHFSSGLNCGAKYLIKEIGKCNIILSNSDVIIKGEEDLRLLSSDIKNDIGVVGPVIDQHGEISRGWPMPTVGSEILFNLPLISRFFRKKLLNYNEEHFKGDTTEVDVVSGCFFLVSSKLLEEVDFFDENTFLYYEEQIFASKRMKTKFKCIIDNRVTILHDHSVTVDKAESKLNKYRILKSSQRYFVKEYLGANNFEMALLYITNKISLGLMHIRCVFRR